MIGDEHNYPNLRNTIYHRQPPQQSFPQNWRTERAPQGEICSVWVEELDTMHTNLYRYELLPAL